MRIRIGAQLEDIRTGRRGECVHVSKYFVWLNAKDGKYRVDKRFVRRPGDFLKKCQIRWHNLSANV